MGAKNGGLRLQDERRRQGGEGYDNSDDNDEWEEEYKSKIMGWDMSDTAGGEDKRRRRIKGERQKVGYKVQKRGRCVKQICDCKG